jgi:hypothetical protein
MNFFLGSLSWENGCTTGSGILAFQGVYCIIRIWGIGMVDKSMR